jgi:hypothetical protein
MPTAWRCAKLATMIKGTTNRASWVAFVLLALGCGNGSAPTPGGLSCNEPTQCVYSSQGAEVCHQSCFVDAGACPSGQVCTGASACCGGVPANACPSPLVMVCCPASGC